MVADTRERNRQLNHFTDRDDVWLFGYGSLIYKVDFPYLERRPARIEGWARRFWQGSHDHRGTPETPGRVATLIPAPGESCRGMAYRVTPDVFEHLDHREKNGYLREQVLLEWLEVSGTSQGLVYRASADNPAWLGPAAADPAEDARAIARQVDGVQGPSGKNRDYVLQLHDALLDLGEEDRHVADIAATLKLSAADSA